MKFAQLGIIAMMGIILVIVCTGCLTTESSSPETMNTIAENSPEALVTTRIQTSASTPIPTTPDCAYPPLNPWTWVPESFSRAATLSPEPGTLISKADLFGTPSLRWDEYEYSQQIRNLPDSYGTSRMEKSREDFKGQSVIHENHTYALHIPGQSAGMWDTTMDDMYYDEYGNMLSMHRRVIRDGQYLEDRDYPPVDLNRGTPDCSGEIFSPKYTYIGIDPVTVPAGSYPAAMKYVSDADDDALSKTATVTSWFAEGVPVSVKWKIEDREKGLFFTYELRGWG